MSELGEISSEVRQALARFDRLLQRFAQLDRSELAPLEAELGRAPQSRPAAALIGRARVNLRQAQGGVLAARRSGVAWLDQHGSGQSGGGGGSGTAGRLPDPGPASGPGAFSSAAVAGAWDLSFATPGGRAYFSPNEPAMIEAAKALPPFPAEYTVDAHGSSEYLEVDGQRLRAAEVAELIRADEDWGGRPVRLFSCHTGRGERPVAAEVAQELGVRVTAPDDVAWSDANGSSGVGPVKVKLVNGVVVEAPEQGGEGAWQVFDPDPTK